MKKRLNEMGNVVYDLEEEDIREVDGEDYIRIPREFLPMSTESEDEMEDLLARVVVTPLPGGGLMIEFPDEDESS